MYKLNRTETGPTKYPQQRRYIRILFYFAFLAELLYHYYVAKQQRVDWRAINRPRWCIFLLSTKLAVLVNTTITCWN